MLLHCIQRIYLLYSGHSTLLAGRTKIIDIDIDTIIVGFVV
jgi:hypothetical protein